MSLHRMFVSTVALMVAAAPLTAQRLASSAFAPPVATVAQAVPPVIATVQTPTAASSITYGPAGAHVMTTTAVAAPLAQPEYNRTRNNTALMIAGGAGLLAGAVIGGDSGTIIMIGGATVGILGLYRYLR